MDKESSNFEFKGKQYFELKQIQFFEISVTFPKASNLLQKYLPSTFEDIFLQSLSALDLQPSMAIPLKKV
jgi:hypothetical protein